jgi:hypothetical protein
MLRPTDSAQPEFLSRRGSFCWGNAIELSDGQTWIFPPPPKKSEQTAVSFGSAYNDIIQAMLEAEDRSEQYMAELSLAIFLLDQNYDLSPDQYQRVLGSNTSSPAMSDWQRAFHEIAQEHMHVFVDTSCDSSLN